MARRKKEPEKKTSTKKKKSRSSKSTTKAENGNGSGEVVEKEVEKLAGEVYNKVVRMARRRVKGESLLEGANGSSPKERSQSQTTGRSGKVSHIREELLSGKSDSEIADQGYNLSTIRTIKWQLRKSGELQA